MLFDNYFKYNNAIEFHLISPACYSYDKDTICKCYQQSTAIDLSDTKKQYRISLTIFAAKWELVSDIFKFYKVSYRLWDALDLISTSFFSLSF